MHDSPLDRAA